MDGLTIMIFVCIIALTFSFVKAIQLITIEIIEDIEERRRAWRRRKRVPTRVHSRKIDRNVARVQMKKAGVHRPNKRIAYNWRLYSEQ